MGGVKSDLVEKYLDNGGIFEKVGKSFVYTQIETDSEKETSLVTTDNSIQLSTKNPDSLKKIGININANGKYEKDGWIIDDSNKDNATLGVYENAIQVDPENPKAWYNKASVLHRLGKNKEAVEAIDRAIQIDPKYSNAWSKKGKILKQMGRYQEADEAFAKAKELR